METASPLRRLFANILDGILFFLTLIIGFFADAILLLMDDQDHRSLSDRVAGTVIVRNNPGAM